MWDAMSNSSTLVATIHEAINSAPLLADDPFTHTLLGIYPSPIEKEYSLFQYWIILALLGPILYNFGYCYLTSVISGEWVEMGDMSREALIATKGLILTSPFLAYAFKEMFEMRWGHIYYYDKLDHANDANPWQTWVYTFMLSPLGFWFASDTTFYFGHRFWHNPILYKWSHYHHHSCRPTTSFAGNAADIFELIFTGYASAVVPVLVVPMDAQVFMVLTTFSQWWTVYLHNHSGHILPGWLDWVYQCHDHNIHHYYGERNYNFGLYFRFWDRLLGTHKAAVPSCKRLSRTTPAEREGLKSG